MDLEPLYWVNFALVLIVGLVAWFLKRLIYSLDEMMKKVHQLEIDVAIIDSRGSYPGATMYIGGWGIDPVHGTLAGFVANPDGTHHPYYGAGSFDSTDELVTGSFQFYAYYVSICSGRGCGGTLGWHYRMLSGSTIEDAR